MDKPIRRLIVIDDDMTDRELIIRLLGARCAVVQAAVARDGLNLLQSFRPHCVLLDYRLPDMDGLEALRLIKSEGVPVVMLTGEGDEEVAVEAMKAGAFDYLIKNGLQTARLTSAIDRAIDQTLLQEKLDAAKLELEGFVGGATQELLTPLSSIRDSLHTVLQRHSDGLPAEAQTLVSQSSEVADDLCKMIEQLIAFSELGTEETALSRVDLNEIASDAVRKVDVKAKASGAKISIGKLPIVHGVASELALVFQNLIANAINHNDNESPRLTLEAKQIGQEHVVSFKDNGAGIPEEHNETIFSPLQKLSGDTPGYGLGLAACRKIIRRHDGRLWVESSGRRGANFQLALPASQPSSN